MQLLAIGLNHRTAPLKIREQVSFNTSALCPFLEGHDCQNAQLIQESDRPVESVVLSTCNRLEYYALAENLETATEQIIEFISQASQIPRTTFQSHLYHLHDEAVVKHLMRVAAGLDSMVLGEAQILGQVVQAYQEAQVYHISGLVLSRLFEMAIHAGKRARTETEIGLNPASISSVAIRLAQHHLGDLSKRAVMIVGAGEMARLASKALLKQGIQRLLVVNRTKSRAEELATRWDVTPLTFDQLEEGISQVDLVVTSTAAPHTILHQNQVAQAMQARPDRPLLIIDIALPRDVDMNVGQLPGVQLYNIDHLQTQIEESLKARQQEIPKVEAILATETAQFMNWYRSLGVVPTLTSLRQRFEDIRQQELQRALNRLGPLDEREQKIVAELSRRLMNKFLHQPTVRLRAEAARGNGITYSRALRELFALELKPP
jgi:glutamyl-tRNA reductase